MKIDEHLENELQRAMQGTVVPAYIKVRQAATYLNMSVNWLSSGMFGEGAGSINNLKTNTKYDDDIKHSKELHSVKCREHKRSVYDSYKGRKFVSADRTDFDALLGKGGLYADHMPASDIPLRKKMGNLLINEMHSLWRVGEDEPELNFYWVTFVADKYMFNERGGTAEVYKLTQAVQAALRNYTSLSAIGVIENHEPLRVFRRLICLSYAAMSDLSRAA